MAAAMPSMSCGLGSGRPMITATSTSRQRSIPSMASKCATSTSSIAGEIVLDVLVGDDQVGAQMTAHIDQALPLAAYPILLLGAALAGRQGLQRCLADRQPDHLSDPHVRRLDIEIEGELEVRQIVAHDLERQGGVGVNYR